MEFKNLHEIMQIKEGNARAILEQIRWPDGPICPHCNGTLNIQLAGKSTRQGVYKCKNSVCRKQFTVTVGTIFEKSHIPLKKWIAAFWMMITARKGVSALQLQRDLGLGSYEAAWHMAHRLRLMMKTKNFAAKLDGTIEVDETYVGGKPRPFGGPKSKRGRGTGKTPLVVMIERDGNARTAVVPDVSSATLHPIIKENVQVSAIINTDEWRSYNGLGEHFQDHRVINHGRRQYVNGDICTNTAESFFALVKRAHYGIFHYISKKHLHRYASEIEFKWNHNKLDNCNTVEDGLKMAEGKRLMYKDLIN